MIELSKKVGSLFVIGFEGTSVSPELRQLMTDYHIGSVILFSRNITSAEQLKKLTTEIQATAQEVGYEHPVLICLDQENGVIRRITEDITLFPGQMSQAATNDPSIARKIAEATAIELKNLGINWNLAPVADINNNPENPIIGVRSFGDQPEKVAQYVGEALAGYQAQHMISSVKHFPGHGDTMVDSHLAVPVIEKSLDELKQMELVPFERAITLNCDTIMISHIIFSSLDSQPASISKLLITDLLRDELGYKGVVVSDCLEMDAISQTVGVVEGSYQAFNAGADLLMISHTYEKQIAAMDHLIAKIKQGEISEQRLEKSLERMEQLISKHSIDFDFELSSFEKKEHEELAEKAYQMGCVNMVPSSITSPLITEDDKIVVLFPDEKNLLRVEDIHNAYDFDKIFKELTNDTTFVTYNHQGLIDCKHEELLTTLGQNDKIMLFTVNVNMNDWLVNFSSQLILPTVHFVMRNPYDLDKLSLPNRLAGVVMFEPTQAVITQAMNHLDDLTYFTGEMPIRLQDN
ncbi:beta-N-acetylhexosaminidase [Vagococcus zengguangii]|uniref:beta-N-acetylhexosaminidase n=1 Tax=Vagococcus zengguangii TaxID=2571750 RepID=UPI0012AFC5F0|nr:beta-N-acetylhexosaminidase [Vagococcus zengguangii]